VERQATMSTLGVRHDQRTIQTSNFNNYLLPAVVGNRPLARNFARFSRRRRRRSISRRLSIFLCLATKVSFLSLRVRLEKKPVTTTGRNSYSLLGNSIHLGLSRQLCNEMSRGSQWKTLMETSTSTGRLGKAGLCRLTGQSDYPARAAAPG
jgi:hypothetical protein